MANLDYLARVAANTSTFQSPVDRAAQSIDRLADRTERADQKLRSTAKRLDDYGAKAQRMGGLLSATVTPAIVALGTHAVNAAADLGEAASKNTVVFGDQADAMEDWAATGAESFGLSTRAALDASGSFGAMFEAMDIVGERAADMSQGVVQLAGDLASFHNADPTDMLDRLRSGLAGEVEPLRRFGVNISAAAVETRALEMGLGGVTGELTEAEKVQARYALIMEQTTTAQGDFLRTSESLPNQIRSARAEYENAAAALGEQLLPYATDAIEVVRGLIDQFAGLDEGSQKLVIQLGLAAAAAGPLTFALGTAARAAGALINGYRVLVPAIARATPIIIANSGAIAAAAAPVAAVVAALWALDKAADALEFDVDIDELTDDLAALAETGEATGTVVDTLGTDFERLPGIFSDIRAHGDVLPSIFGGLAAGINGITFGLTDFETTTDQALGRMDATGQALAQLADRDLEAAVTGFYQLRTEAELAGISYGELATHTSAFSDVLSGQGISLEYLVAQMDAGVPPAEALANAQAAAADAAGDHAGALDEQGEAAGEAAGETRTLAEAVADLVAEQRAAVDPMFAAIKATRDYDGAVTAAADARTALAEGEGTEAELEAAVLALAEAGITLEHSLLEAAGAGGEAQAVLAGLADRGLLTAGDMRILEAALGETRVAAEDLQGEYDVMVLAETDDVQLTALEERLRDITGRTYRVNVRADTYTPNTNYRVDDSGNVSSGGSSSGGGNSFRKFGGPTIAGHPYWVGEREAELFVPDEAGRILTGNDLARMGRQGDSKVVHDNRRFVANVNTDRPVDERDASIELRKLASVAGL